MDPRLIPLEDAERRVNRPTLEIVNAADLIGRTFPEPKYIVPGLIVEGLTVFGGKPKIGKSWAALNIAHAVAAGTKALGNIAVEPGEVLYLALEDTQRRLQGRLKTILQGAAPSDRLEFVTHWPRLDAGGLDDLDLWCREHPAARLIVIDTWARVRPAARKGRSFYDDDYAAVEPLKELADRHAVGIVLVHHLRKQVADDPLDEVSGSTGLTGAADSVLILKRERAQADAVLHATGRDIEESETAMQFDRETGAWTCLGNANDFRHSREQMAVIRALGDSAVPLKPKELADILDKPRAAVKMMLSRMAKDGSVRSDGHGGYTLPTT